MDKNLHDVVTILLVNSDNASASDLAAEFETAQIVPYAYTPQSTTTALDTWPTLNDMIVTGKRLVIFVADIDTSNSATPYLLNEFTFVFENPFDVTSPTNFTCTPDRPASVQGQTSVAIESGRLPLMNHFLDIEQGLGIQIPDVGNISVTNANTGPVGNLGSAANECTKLYGKPPTFILVDFFDQGPAISTVDSINRITPVGRKSFAAAMKNSTSGAVKLIRSSQSSFVGTYSLLALLVAIITAISL